MRVKNFLFFLSILYFILYIPLFYTIYFSSWYEFNYELSNTAEYVEEDLLKDSTSNLINYFSHKEELNDYWTQKERLHFYDVKKIYDFLFILFLISCFSLIYNYDKRLIKTYTKINYFIISSLFLIVPFFIYFWDKIFHKILFNNNFWITYPNELSYYLFTYNFFRNSLILIILISLILNFILFLISKIKG
jgi:uncharacterized membrane protein